MDRCSASLLPYLEGDFWPGEAENLLATLGQEGGGGGSGKSGGGGGRKGGSKAKRYGADAGTVDQQLMAKLGDILGTWLGGG
jgi:E1A/CREB-binding protein